MDCKTYYIVKNGDIIDKLYRIDEPETNCWDEWKLEYGNISDYLWKRIEVVEEEHIDKYLINTVHSRSRSLVIKDNGEYAIYSPYFGLNQSRLEELKDFYKNTGLGIESYLEFMNTLEGL